MIAATGGNEFPCPVKVFFLQVLLVVKISRNNQNVIQKYIFIVWLLKKYIEFIKNKKFSVRVSTSILGFTLKVIMKFSVSENLSFLSACVILDLQPDFDGQ